MLTVISAGRDPNHAGNLRQRTKVAHERNMHYARKHGVDVEWIFVEWNPTDEMISPMLADMCVKCYIVSNELHTRLAHPDLPDYNFMDGFANNVGSRRATNEWMLITNNDSIIGPNVWEFIKRGELDPKVMYRAERRDIPSTHFGRSFTKMERRKIKIYSIANKLRHAAGSFMLVSMQEYSGYDERINDTNWHIDGHLCWNWVENIGNTMQPIGRVFKADHELVLWKSKHNTFIPHKGRKQSELGIIYIKSYVNTPHWGLPEEPVKEAGQNMWRIG